MENYAQKFNYYQEYALYQGQIRRISPHRYENLLKKMKKKYFIK